MCVWAIHLEFVHAFLEHQLYLLLTIAVAAQLKHPYRCFGRLKSVVASQNQTGCSHILVGSWSLVVVWPRPIKMHLDAGLI